jgi:hypothetical protein
MNALAVFVEGGDIERRLDNLFREPNRLYRIETEPQPTPCCGHRVSDHACRARDQLPHLSEQVGSTLTRHWTKQLTARKPQPQERHP